jgi:hypothetical protein
MPASPRKGFERVTKELRISSEFFIDFLRRPVPKCVTSAGVPEDAKIVGARFEPITGHVVLTIESASFRDAGDLIVLFSTRNSKENYDARDGGSDQTRP